MTGQPGGMTVFVTARSLMSKSPLAWHLPGRVDGPCWSTCCGRVIAEWPADGSRPAWAMVAILRLYAGAIGSQCLTCKKAALAGGRS